jgi:hypothetical protein
MSALLTLALMLAGASVPAADVAAFVDDVAAVVEVEAPLLDSREATGRLLVVWAWGESSWRTGALGDCSNPAHRTVATCRSFGVLQMNRMWLGGEVEAVLSDRRLALRRGLALMRDLAGKCGSVRAGLRAYASGSCQGTIRSRRIVDHRLKLAGVP